MPPDSPHGSPPAGTPGAAEATVAATAPGPSPATASDGAGRRLPPAELLGRLGRINHDFNNVLTVVRGNAELLCDTVAPADAELLGEILAYAFRGMILTRTADLLLRRDPPRAAGLAPAEVAATLEGQRGVLARLLGGRGALALAPAPGAAAAEGGRCDRWTLELLAMVLALHAAELVPDGREVRLGPGAADPAGAPALPADADAATPRRAAVPLLEAVVPTDARPRAHEPTRAQLAELLLLVGGALGVTVGAGAITVTCWLPAAPLGAKAGDRGAGAAAAGVVRIPPR